MLKTVKILTSSFFMLHHALFHGVVCRVRGQGRQNRRLLKSSLVSTRFFAIRGLDLHYQIMSALQATAVPPEKLNVRYHEATPLSNEKPVLAVDIDEVLAFFMPALVDFHNECSESDDALTPRSFFSYDFHHVWGGSKEATLDKVNFAHQV